MAPVHLERSVPAFTLPPTACSGHQSFSNNRSLNDLVGNIVHSFILVPYHGWRISHRTHHGNHGHVENDHSWHPLTEQQYKQLVSSWLGEGGAMGKRGLVSAPDRQLAACAHS